jgi:hypothetical protein
MAGCVTVQVPAPQCAPAHTPPEATATAEATPSSPSGAAPSVALDPSTWHRTGMDPTAYRWSRDESVVHAGGPTMRFEQVPGRASIDSWAGTIASVPADGYRGLRVRFRADVRTENAPVGASLWLRLDDAPSHSTEICNMINPVDGRLKGTNDFTTIACVLDVPQSTKTLVFGLLLTGPGVAWIGPATLEPVSLSVPESPHA